MLAQREHKWEDKRSILVQLIQRAKADAQTKIRALGVDTEKTKKIVENSVFITSLNLNLETAHSQIFTLQYKHQLLYLHFVVSQPLFKAAREFEYQYQECMKVERADNKFFREWKDRLQKELLRFNGKVAIADGGESISDATSEGIRSQKQLRPKSALKSS